MSDGSSFHISGGSVAVADDIYYFPMKDCPKGVKIIALTTGGIAVFAIYTGKETDLVGWYPMPKRRKELS